MNKLASTVLAVAFLCGAPANDAFADAYFDPSKVPHDSSYGQLPKLRPSRKVALEQAGGLESLRISVKVDPKTEKYSLATLTKEMSGTEAMSRRASQAMNLGSYRATLKSSTGKVVANDSIGTGKEFRKLVDAITFRFPSQAGDLIFEVSAENPVTGKIEKVFETKFNADQVSSTPPAPQVDVRELNPLPVTNSRLRINFYAEGYTEERKELFFLDAEKALASMIKNNFPLVDKLSFYAVFAPSKQMLGSPNDLGLPVKERDSFLGLYFPYWDKFGRWTDVVYPTREDKFRRALATAPYDYAVVLADDAQYWGVGNFREITAIPAHNDNFIYLLTHEIGHFFGLNEEYDSYGRTELEFAPGITEPWSQNITFLRSGKAEELKWKKFVSADTPIPTSLSTWQDSPPKYGAYPGGYAESPPLGHSHKPGLSCVMDRGADFCDICHDAVSKVIQFDLGLAN